jgi:hypothetical protein
LRGCWEEGQKSCFFRCISLGTSWRVLGGSPKVGLKWVVYERGLEEARRSGGHFEAFLGIFEGFWRVFGPLGPRDVRRSLRGGS